MTEQDWLTSTDPAAMLDFLRGGNPLRAECPTPPPSARKLRLFAAACCYLVWDKLTDERSRRAVETASRYVDGEATEAELLRAYKWPGVDYNNDALWQAQSSARWCCAPADDFARLFPNFSQRLPGTPATQAALIRHIFGNPWRSAVVPATIPAVVRELAATLYGGEDCACALHDSLEEAGEASLAQHFLEKDHPKGCFALDAILKKT